MEVKGRDGRKVIYGSKETSDQKVARLEADNAQMIYDAMMKDLAIEDLSNTQSDLLYQLMTNGVI